MFIDLMYCFKLLVKHNHCHSLVKNTPGATPNFGEQNAVKTDKCLGVSQLLWAHARIAPQPTPMSIMEIGNSVSLKLGGLSLALCNSGFPSLGREHLYLEEALYK